MSIQKQSRDKKTSDFTQADGLEKSRGLVPPGWESKLSARRVERNQSPSANFWKSDFAQW
jgi:hypothetical protein